MHYFIYFNHPSHWKDTGLSVALLISVVSIPLTNSIVSLTIPCTCNINHNPIRKLIQFKLNLVIVNIKYDETRSKVWVLASCAAVLENRWDTVHYI